MDNVISSFNALQEGVFLMKNFFLYVKTDGMPISQEKFNDIFCFNECKLLAVNIQKYNSKKTRLDLQNELNIRPYFVTQSVFKEFLFYISNNSSELFLEDINFKNKFVEEEYEFDNLMEKIQKRNYNEILKSVQEIENEYDTDLENIVVRFKGYSFTITSEGVIDTDSPEDIFKEFTRDKAINKLLLGLY